METRKSSQRGGTVYVPVPAELRKLAKLGNTQEVKIYYSGKVVLEDMKAKKNCIVIEV